MIQDGSSPSPFTYHVDHHIVIKIPAAAASQGQPQIIMSGGSQYGNQVAYQNIIPTAVPLQIINQANAVQPGQQFILIDQANGRQQIVQMPSEMTGQVQQAPVSQTRIIQQSSEQQQQHQPAKKVRRIEHQDNTSMRGSVDYHVIVILLVF